MRPADTSEAAWAIQVDAWRRLGAEGRRQLAFELSDELLEQARASILRRHPDLDAAGLCAALVELLHGRP